MLIDNAVITAKTACSRFLANVPSSPDAAKTALEPVLDAAQKVLVAAHLTLATKKIALELYRGHRDAAGGVDVRQTTRISLLDNGKLIKEDKITCKDGCHLIGSQSYFVEIEALLKSGVSAKTVVENISSFLDDPNFGGLASGMKN